MPRTPYDISFDLSTLPAWAQQLVTDIDAAIATGWPIEFDATTGAIERKPREFVFLWANYDGYSAAKANIIRDKVLPFYVGARGWRQARAYTKAPKSTTTQFTVIFEY